MDVPDEELPADAELAADAEPEGVAGAWLFLQISFP